MVMEEENVLALHKQEQMFVTFIEMYVLTICLMQESHYEEWPLQRLFLTFF